MGRISRCFVFEYMTRGVRFMSRVYVIDCKVVLL